MQKMTSLAAFLRPRHASHPAMSDRSSSRACRCRLAPEPNIAEPSCPQSADFPRKRARSTEVRLGATQTEGEGRRTAGKGEAVQEAHVECAISARGIWRMPLQWKDTGDSHPWVAQ
jgi:hypothetical protein